MKSFVIITKVTNIVMKLKQTVYEKLKLHTDSSFYINIENVNTK